MIAVLGAGCPNCRRTIGLIQTVAHEAGVPIALEKVEAIPDIIRYGAMSTPGVVNDGQVVHAGGVPSRAKVEGWLRQRVA